MSIAPLCFRHVAQLAEALIVYVNAEKIKKIRGSKKILQSAKKYDIIKVNGAKSIPWRYFYG